MYSNALSRLFNTEGGGGGGLQRRVAEMGCTMVHVLSASYYVYHLFSMQSLRGADRIRGMGRGRGENNWKRGETWNILSAQIARRFEKGDETRGGVG